MGALIVGPLCRLDLFFLKESKEAWVVVVVVVGFDVTTVAWAGLRPPGPTVVPLVGLRGVVPIIVPSRAVPDV